MMSGSSPICTLRAFCAARRLDESRLRELRIFDEVDGLHIPCLDEYGRLTGSVRVRRYLESAHPTTWIGKPTLYGLQTLRRARERRELIMVEGESDQLTLREHGLPAIGVPGATMTRLLELQHVSGIEIVYALREPDHGGSQFIAGLTKRLHELRWGGILRVVDISAVYGFKDVSALHVSDPVLFPIRWQAATEAATQHGVPGEATNTRGLTAKLGLNLCDLSTERFERVVWFEEAMIPRVELTLVNGDGGIGKTTAMLDLIARASAGKPMPSGLRHDRQLKCLIVAEEDRLGLLRARLDAAGANHFNIRLIKSVGGERDYFTIPRHAEVLRAEIADGNWDVILIDALLNHLDDDVNASKPQEMRNALRPLVDVAHVTGATIIAIRHIGKGTGPASTRGFGSAEARNLCRSELTIAPHPDQEAHPNLVVIALSKANLSPDRSATMAFSLESMDVSDDDGMPTTIASVKWMEAPPKISADELLERPDSGERSRNASAVDYLKDALSSGARRAFDVITEGKRSGHSQATLYRARKAAGVTSEMRGGFPMQSYWFLKEPLVSHASHEDNLDNPGRLEKPTSLNESDDEVRL